MLIHRVAKDEMVMLTDASFTIYTARSGPRGWAYYGMPPRIKIGIPKTPFDHAVLARVISHELAHSQNVHHGKALPSTLDPEALRIKYSWASAIPIELKVIPTSVKNPSAIIQKKMSHSMKMAERWSSKVKLSQTLLRKWKHKVAYYDKQLAKAAAQSIP